MNKTTKIILLIIILAGGFLFFTNRQQERNQDPAPPAEEQSDVTESAELPADAKYQLVTENSRLGWTSTRIVGKPHSGTVALKSGSLMREGGAFTGGEFVIDMTGITEEEDNQRFLGHIRSEDFFDIEQHPESRLVLTSIEGNDEDMTYTVTGDLTILGQTHAITFPASITAGESSLEAQARFEIDRTQWGITYDSGTVFQQIGDKAIRDEIPFELDLVFTTGE